MVVRARYLKCACCAGYAGHWQQHSNQDTGWGICRRCVDWLKDERGYSADQIADLYGTESVNFAPSAAPVAKPT